MKKHRSLVISILGVVLLIFIGKTIFKKLSDLKTTPQHSTSILQEKKVKAIRIENKNYPNISTNLGRVRAKEKIEITSEVQGRLIEGKTSLKAGNQFQKGELLFQIEHSTLFNSLNAQKSDLLQQIATILPDIRNDYKSEFDKWKNYFDQFEIEKKVLPLPSFNSAREKTFITSKGILKLYYQIKSEEDRLNKHFYYAPFQGSYLQTLVENNTIVNANTKVATIIRDDVVEIESDLEAGLSNYFNIGDKVMILPTGSQKKVEGRLDRKVNAVDPNTQRSKIFISAKNTTKTLIDGSYVQIEMQGKTLEKVAAIPKEALVENTYVYTIDSDMHVVKTLIELIKTENNYAFVRGLSDGTTIVAESLINIVGDLKVAPYYIEFNTPSL